WNLAQVASKAKGNEIGSITDLQTSCMAAGHPELAYELVRELQNALDSLKHGTQVDRERIAAIRKQIKTAPWLKYKREEQVSRMPVSVEVEPTAKWVICTTRFGKKWTISSGRLYPSATSTVSSPRRPSRRRCSRS